MKQRKLSVKNQTRKKNPWIESQEDFLSLPDDVRASSKTFEHFYGTKPDEKIVWKILMDNEQITTDAMGEHNDEIYHPIKLDIPWSSMHKDVDYNLTFFKYFFPSLKGKAKLMDEYLGDRRCSMYTSVLNDKIRFYDPDREDPDALVRLCVTIIIIGALEVHNGIENLWKSGEAYGLKKYPNFGQYIPVNYFHAFVCAFPFVWGDKVYWFKPKNDLPWTMFLPFLQLYNEMRTKMTDVRYAILDESMSGWRPKTSKTGGLPNITFEPLKPKNLGTIIRNSAECVTGMIVNHDIVQGQAEQAKKKYVDAKSSLPKGERIQAHVAEVLRQAESSKVTKGGWIGGDAWFGSVNTCVELMKTKGIFSTFIIKQNLNYCPTQVLHSILLARHKNRPAGHWVVMKAVISGVDLFIMVYAYSNKRVAYFVSTSGTTVRHSIPYKSCYEDGYGNPTFKLLPRPAIAHFVYEFLPLIDEHNKARQSNLALEEKWPTKCCWFRLFTTFIGMAVVDLQRWDRNMRNGNKGVTPLSSEVPSNFNIMRMCDLIGRPLMDGSLRYVDDGRGYKSPRMTQHEHIRVAAGIDGAQLRRYTKNGQLANEKGKAYQRYCYICRTHGEIVNTQWICNRCEMPLCKKDRRGDECACLEEHLKTTVADDACGPVRTCFRVPETSLKVRLASTRGDSSNKRRRDRIPAANSRSNKRVMTKSPPPPPPPPPPPLRPTPLPPTRMQTRTQLIRRHRA